MRQVCPTSSPAVTSFVERKCLHETRHILHYSKENGTEKKCTRCLDGMQPQCPLCRDEFSPQDIRKLRVDSDGPSSTTVAPQVDTQVQRLLDDIAKTANGVATVQEMERVIDLCDAYHNAQSHSSPVRDRPRPGSQTDSSISSAHPARG